MLKRKGILRGTKYSGEICIGGMCVKQANATSPQKGSQKRIPKRPLIAIKNPNNKLNTFYLPITRNNAFKRNNQELKKNGNKSTLSNTAKDLTLKIDNNHWIKTISPSSLLL